MDAISDIKRLAHMYCAYLDEIPELGWQEQRTSAYIQSKLGKPHWVNKTALIYAVGKGIPIFFRSELDAINTIDGPKHVCGHSSHTAVLMAIYEYVKKYPVSGYKIYFIFQPCEEGFPSGAQYIVDTWKELPRCRAGFAFHTFPSRKVGELFNPHMGGGDYVEIHLQGAGSHVKNKYSMQADDVLLAASEVCLRVNTSRYVEGLVNIGKITAGEASNSIAEKAVLVGDIRYVTVRGKNAVLTLLTNIQRDIRQRYKTVDMEMRYFAGYPVLKNQSRLLSNARKILPVKQAIQTFATEDFSLYPVPLLFLLIGTGEKTELHHKQYHVSNKTRDTLIDYWLKLLSNLPVLLN